MIYNDSQLFAITRAHYFTNEELAEEQEITMQEKQAQLIALGYTVEKAEEVKAPATPLKVRSGSEVTLNGESYYVTQCFYITKKHAWKFADWTVVSDKQLVCSSKATAGKYSAKTLKELKQLLADQGFKQK